jgi:hypothetical protein
VEVLKKVISSRQQVRSSFLCAHSHEQPNDIKAAKLLGHWVTMNAPKCTLYHEMSIRAPSFFLRAPQQTLRTHRSLEASCATLWWRWRWWWLFLFASNGMKLTGENRSTQRKTCPSATLSIRNPTRASAVGDRRLTAWAMAWPWHLALPFYLVSYRCLCHSF